MPVNVSNPGLRGIQAEYGGTGTLRAYVRGGAIVPINANNNISTNANGLSIRQFAGTTKPPTLAVSLNNHDITAYNFNSFAFAYARFILNSNGIAQANAVTSGGSSGTNDLIIDGNITTPPTLTNIETWLDSGSSGDVSVFVTVTGGPLQAGSSALSTYLPLSTTRYWEVYAETSVGAESKSATLNISFVQTSNTANVLDTATITLLADVFSPN